MAFKDQINKDMQVRNSSGTAIGVVDAIEGERIKLTAKDSTDGRHHYVPISDVTRVDGDVHLRTEGLAPDYASGTPAGVHKDSGGLGKILPWLALALGVIVLLAWLAGSFDGRDDGAKGVTDTGAFSSNNADGSEATTRNSDGTSGGAAATAAAGVGTLGTYLGGTEATPRTFAFETLNFDTGKADVRAADKAELDSVTVALKQGATSRVRIIGYTDAPGTEPANAQLGKQRADAVKAALVAAGIEAGRIETDSGGEDAPTGSNATAGGRAENRRTEIVVLSR